jgi:3-oxoacyl-(acyl-carrier-protein) synthase
VKHERVFVLDHDLISPLGIGNGSVLSSLKANHLAGGRISRFPTDGMTHSIAAEVKGDLSELYAHEDDRIKETLAFDRKLELMVCCYHKMRNRLDNLFARIAPERAGVSLGMGSDVIPFELVDSVLSRFADHADLAYGNTIEYLNRNGTGINRVLNPPDFTAVYLAGKLNLAAFQHVILTACAASTQAIAMAFNHIRRGDADMALAGGTDSIIDMISHTAFSKLGVVAADIQPENRTCRPFDISRDGTLAGESASLVVLAGENTVNKLSLEPRLEILGYGNTLDGFKITAPDPGARGMIRALAQALSNAGITPKQVDYINLHGTGTLANDPLELKAIREVFGDCAAHLPISSTKDRHGHAIAAAGSQEFVITAICMQNDLIPYNVNLKTPIDDTVVNLVKDENIMDRLDICLTSNFAFGGVNTVLVLKRV